MTHPPPSTRSQRRKPAVPDAAITAGHVRDVILKDLDRQSGEDGQWQVEGPLVQARVSWIFRAESPRARVPLAVKVYRPATRPNHVEEQADLLRRYHAAMASRPGLTVPALWAVLPRHRTLIMEWIEEPQLARLLSRAGRRRERRAELFAAAGRWLRAYHDQSGIVMLPLATDRLQAQIDAMVHGAPGNRTDRPTAPFLQACKVLRDHAGSFAGLAVPHAHPHGDFNGNNLFHGGGRTIGIDLSASPQVPVTHDICRFLVQCETTKPFLTRKSTLAPCGVERQDLDAFLRAYDPPAELLDERVFNYLHLAEILRRWGTLFGRSKGPFHAVRRMKHFRLARMARYAAAAVRSPER